MAVIVDLGYTAASMAGRARASLASTLVALVAFVSTVAIDVDLLVPEAPHAAEDCCGGETSPCDAVPHSAHCCASHPAGLAPDAPDIPSGGGVEIVRAPRSSLPRPELIEELVKPPRA